MRQPPTALTAAATLAVGFGIAQATGLRAIGGVVLLAGAAVCARTWHARHGTPTTVALLGTALAAFVLAHVLALGFDVNPWLSVALVSAATAAVTWVVSDRPAAARPRSLATV